MDRFIIKKTKKKNENLFIGHADVIQKIQYSIDNNEMICIYGNSGSGKTFLVEQLLPPANKIEICEQILKNKQLTVDFLEKLKNSYSPVVVDNFDSTLPGAKEILELKKTNSCFIIISLTPIPIPIENVHLPNLTINQLVNLGKIKFPKKPLQKIVEMAKESRGNVRNFLISLDFSDYKDIFKNSKQYIYDLICSDVKYPENASLELENIIQDHGYTRCIIHENYLDSQNADFEIADWMSIADMVDNLIYCTNNWNFIKYFNMYGIILPAMRINHSLYTSTIRPGSAWTKYNNYKMRLSRLKHMRINLDVIQLHHLYLKKGDISHFLHYKFKPQDVDMMNHLCLKTKLKPKNILRIKKDIANAFAYTSKT